MRLYGAPLGVRADTAYSVQELQLAEGDYLILHSDGFYEAANAEEELFGFDRMIAVLLQGCAEGLSPEELISRLIGEVKAFTGEAAQSDDITCVVVRVEADTRC